MMKKTEQKQLELKPYKKNAKKHPKEQLEKIAASLRNFGWQQPIKVGQGGVIIAGHGRYAAYKEFPEGIKEPWVINERGQNIYGEPETRVLSEEEEKAYRYADNKLNESDWDMPIVIEELKELDPDLFNLTGFSTEMLENLSVVDDSSKEWTDMPGFGLDKRSFRSIVVHFQHSQALEAFLLRNDLHITENTKYIWFPPKNE